MSENAVSLAALSIVGGVFATMTYIIRYGLKVLSNDLRNHTKAAQEVAKTVHSFEKTVHSLETYMRERNGKDGEIHEYQIAAIAKLSGDMRHVMDDTVKEIKLAMQTVKVQNVGTQVVTDKKET